MKVLTLLLIVLACSASRSQQLQHDVSVDSILSPSGTIVLGYSTVVKIRYTNRGMNDETNVPIYLVAFDRYQNLIYRDTMWTPLIKSGQTIDKVFASITATTTGQDQFCAASLLNTDQNQSNDKSCGTAFVTYQKDFAAVALQYPKGMDSIEYQTPFKTIATFQNRGTIASFLKSRIEIRNFFTHQLVFQADTSLADSLQIDSSVTIVFPDRQNVYDTRKMLPGKYILAALSRSAGDGDLSNDTVYSVLTIFADHDLGIDSIFSISDTMAYGDSVPLYARYTNYGAYGEVKANIAIRIMHNGVAIRNDTMPIANLSRGETRDLPIGTFHASDLGQYQICAYTVFPTDQDPTNNSRCASTVVFHKHDIRAEDLRGYSLLDGHQGDTLPMIATFTNNGLADEASARFACTIALNNITIYADTVSASVERFGSIQVQFKPYIIATRHPVMICVTSLLASDEDHANDGSCVLGQNTGYANLKALAVDWPRKDDSVTVPFAAVARFMNTGYGTLFNARFSVEIDGIDDPSQHRTIPGGIGNFPGSSTSRSFTFDSNATYYLTPGRYRIAAIARAGDDTPSDDTAYSTFSIVGPARQRVDLGYVTSFKARIDADHPLSPLLALSLAEHAHVSFEIFDMTGRRVAAKILGDLQAGEIRMPLDVSDRTSGRYEVVVRAGERTVSLPFVVLH